MKHKMRKLLSVLLCCFMLLSLMPAAFAEGTESEETPDIYVAKIGSTQYTTLDGAVAEAADGSTIELLADCTTSGFNLSKNLTIQAAEAEVKPTITFTEYGIALWGKALTFKNVNVVMNGIGSTPYTAEWNWMTICASKDASLTLNNVNMTMDGDPEKTGTPMNKHAIYFCSNNILNLTNGTVLTIQNYGQDALEWDGGDGGYNVNITNSTFVSDHNRSGFTGTFVVTCDGSTINVVNSTGNGSNGSHFDIKNRSVVNFNNNSAHGLSAGWCKITDSTVTTSGNGANGLHTSGILAIDGSTVAVENNKCSISSKWTIPGAVYIGGSGESSIKNSTVTIQNNQGSGIYQKAADGSLTVDSTATVTIVKNTAEKLGYGGGIYVNGTVNFPSNLVLYNNHADTAGDDIYSKGTITFGNTGTGWALDGEPDCTDVIDGWYEDGEGSRWDAHNSDASKQHMVLKDAGQYTDPIALKAAHGVIPENPTPTPKPSNPKPSTSKPISSPKTFDAGIALYGAMALLSLTGGAWVINKKRNDK